MLSNFIICLSSLIPLKTFMGGTKHNLKIRRMSDVHTFQTVNRKKKVIWELLDREEMCVVIVALFTYTCVVFVCVFQCALRTTNRSDHQQLCSAERYGRPPTASGRDPSTAMCVQRYQRYQRYHRNHRNH